MTYERVVTAALAETQSKFKLAEALALDVPPRPSGGSVENDKSIIEHLAEAREAIMAAGGENRQVGTLREYRETALWVMITSAGDDSPAFQWQAASYAAHNEARKQGLTYQEFAASPSKTVRDFRHTSPERPENVVGSWTPEEKAEAAAGLMADPEVADEVMRNPQARSHTRAAISRHDERQDQALRGQHGQGGGFEPLGDPLDLVWEFRQLHRNIDRIAAEVAKRGTIVSETQREALIEEIGWLRNALAMVEDGIKGGSVDAALAEILSGGES